MAGVRSVMPKEFTKLSTRVILACGEHPVLLRTYAIFEGLAWGAETRTIEFDGDWFEREFDIPQPTLLRHLNLLSRQPIRAVLVYRSAGAGYRRFTVTLSEMEAAEADCIKNDTGIKNENHSVVVNNKDINPFKHLLKTTKSGIKNDTVSKTIPAGKPEKPNIFALHEQHFGPLTPLLADQLKDAEKDYPPEWVEAAFEIAVGSNKRFWGYVEGVLKRWKTAGKITKPDQQAAMSTADSAAAAIRNLIGA